MTQEQAKLEKELALDVQAEQARALHRVVRAMHDGHCPDCGHLDSAEKFYSEDYKEHKCPRCSFYVTDSEAREALAEFSPFLKKSVEIFEAWRNC